MNRQMALALALVFTSALRAEPQRPTLDPKESYRAERLAPVTYDVDFAVVVTAPAHTKTLKVWLPMPQTDAGQEVKEVELSSFPDKVEPRIDAEAVFGNR